MVALRSSRHPTLSPHRGSQQRSRIGGLERDGERLNALDFGNLTNVVTLYELLTRRNVLTSGELCILRYL
jgi:hypothetical protein